MLHARYAALTTLCAATIALTGCPSDAPTQTTTPIIGGSGGSAAVIAPFDDIAKGASSLQQAAGMSEGAKSPALTTVAPLQQAAGYRVSALAPTTLPPDDYQDEGLFRTYFDYTAAQKGTENGTFFYATNADYLTRDQNDVEVESGTNIRVLGYKETTDDAGNPMIAVALSESRQATTSTRRAPGTYGLAGAVVLHEQVDYLQLAASFVPKSGGASSSIEIKYTKLYEPSPIWSGTLQQKLASRGAKLSEQVSLKGSLASGESLDLEARKAGTDTAPTRSATASVDLGGDKGKIAFASDLKLSQTSAQSFPTAITGTVTMARRDKSNTSHGQLYINSFTPQSTTRTVQTAGELRTAQGTKVGTFTGKIDLKAGEWLGVYQQDGQATKSINLSGLLSQIW